MRLTKVQKVLKEKGVEYVYKEICLCGEVNFRHKEKYYYVDEITGDRGRTPKGIRTNLEGFDKWSEPKQSDIVEYIKSNL